MKLDDRGAHEIAASISLDVATEAYRLRLLPLARATLAGESRRSIDKCRDLVLPDVWDQGLLDAVQRAVARLRELAAAAEADLAQPLRRSRLARAVVDRVLFELLEDNDRNREAMEELEAELADAPADERFARARRAARGAYAWTYIPHNEIRAAITRMSFAAIERGPERADVVDVSTRHLARMLATDERRGAARAWVCEMATMSAEPFPLLAEQLQLLAALPPARDPADDPVWVEACFGIAMTEALGSS